jgi:hypothetical protein
MANGKSNGKWALTVEKKTPGDRVRSPGASAESSLRIPERDQVGKLDGR